MPSAGFEPAIPAIERSHTYALARAAKGAGLLKNQTLRDVIFTKFEIQEQ
jgi:hypothetical protein